MQVEEHQAGLPPGGEEQEGGEADVGSPALPRRGHPAPVYVQGVRVGGEVAGEGWGGGGEGWRGGWGGVGGSGSVAKGGRSRST